MTSVEDTLHLSTKLYVTQCRTSHRSSGDKCLIRRLFSILQVRIITRLHSRRSHRLRFNLYRGAQCLNDTKGSYLTTGGGLRRRLLWDCTPCPRVLSLSRDGYGTCKVARLGRCGDC